MKMKRLKRAMKIVNQKRLKIDKKKVKKVRRNKRGQNMMKR
jgi:hypothetical protein